MGTTTIAYFKRASRKPAVGFGKLFAVKPTNRDPMRMHDQILRGTPFRALRETAERLGCTPEELAKRCGVSRATYHRKARLPKPLLSSQASDTLARYETLIQKAAETFADDEASARQWLTTAQPGLGGSVPIEIAQTTVGFREVEKLLTRIDFGVYA